uniref:ATP binding cassette subfamily A member 5 n=1 Tax=Scleropages formosus TaxID=113540 RepID=A0A8C9VWP8_SCLFO
EDSEVPDASLWHQTKSLLYKNLLIKWRTKQQSLQVGCSANLPLALCAQDKWEREARAWGGASVFCSSFSFLNPVLVSTGSCLSNTMNCRAANYWYSGFVRLQALIDAAIIQMQTKRSVRREMRDLHVVMMGQPSAVEVQTFPHALISIYLVLAFTPFVSFLIVNVAAEKERRLKDAMTMMGLYDSAFWLSWGLLYAALVTTMSVLMAIIATCTALFPNSDFLVIFLLIFLYGISSVSIFFSFMLTPLFKKPKFASTVGSMLTVVFGCLSLFTVLMKDFPQALVWALCLLSPSAFSIGIAQVVYLEAQGDGAVFSTLTSGPHAVYVPLLMLVLDCILYLLLAIYLDQVLPGEFGMRRSFLYFLKPSYWSKDRKQYVEVSSVFEFEMNGKPTLDESVEPISPEFRGKEHHIFCCCLKLFWGFTFDIYEGQITALLGHSGAGKSTLLNILCGICPPTDGSATIYGSTVSEIAEGVEMRQLVGICPQFNIMFDVLTVEEHLRIFAAIKGIPQANIDGEVTKVLKDLDLEKIMDAQAKNLSGGQKRKLSVGIAILGDPKILLLDEPTAGMDPCSRHQVWSLLKSRRAGRVTVLSTHYMDEADILADRKAVISQGQLKCVGSSLYLKTKCGVGYHLKMSVNEGCEADNITSLVKQHVLEAQLSLQHEAELTYTLPFKSIDSFPGLFSELDCRPDLGISNYGVSMTTLEDVFLRLEAEAEVDQADYSVFNQEHVEDEGDASSQDDIDQRLLTFSESRQDAVMGHALWRQQFRTVAWLHVLNLQREKKAIIYNLALFGIFLASVLALSLITGNIQIRAPDRQFLPIYLLRRNQHPGRYTTSLLVQNSSGSDISDFIHNLESLDIKVELMKNVDYMAAAPHSAAINVTESSKGYEYYLAFNSTTVHSLPMVVNILSNALLHGLNGTGQINAWSKPFDFVSRSKLFFWLLLLGMLTAGMPAYFAMDHTRDREVIIKCRSTLRISGLVPSAYWCGQAAVDIPFYYLILVSVTSTLFAFHSSHLLYSSAVTATICLIGYGAAMVLLTYVVSFMFTRVQSNRDFFSVVSMMVSTSLARTPFPVSVLLICFYCEVTQFKLVTLFCKPVVVVSDLRKEYNARKEGFTLNKWRKVATKNISFCVRKGEVLGLLGPNGAGKSTIMHMVAGDAEPTAGQVLMGDYSTEYVPVENPLEHIGYCPQENPLWPKITLQEHLETYAAIKGLHKEDVPDIIKRVVNALELREHLHKQAKNLSAGIKRKLCFALSMLGNPQIVLLDEPSTGMDPKSKQRMWRAIRAAFKNRQRGAVLTTHYMEEAEAVCDRVAIMVSGQLRCIGSIQHLKGKFGRGYSLEVKLREELTGHQQEALLQKEIMRIFPHAARQERWKQGKTRTSFKVFCCQLCDTPPQVFMEFAKEQENEEEEVGSLSTTFQWHRLQQEGSVPVNSGGDSVVHQL